jgi:glycosyltransferase involved in cell wall biosynthesis
MNIEVFTLTYNNEKMLRYFLRHYSTFCNKITVFDNQSTDNTVSVAKEYGAVVIEYDTKNTFDEATLVDICNSCWEDSNADWVIIVAVDEFIYHPDIIKILEKVEGTIIRLPFYNMFADKFPETDGQIYDEVVMGTLAPTGKPLSLFRPYALLSTNYDPGGHNANPIGCIVVEQNSGIKVLHMSCLGKDYVREHNRIGASRLSEQNKLNGWGGHYYQSEEEWGKIYDEQFRKAVNVINLEKNEVIHSDRNVSET